MDKESRQIIERAAEFRRGLAGHSLSEDDAREVYDACFGSLSLFNFTFLHDYFSDKYGCPPFHREIGKNLIDDSVRFLVITAPRGFSKSTLISLGYSVRQAVYKQERFRIICSSVERIALDWTSKIKDTFEQSDLLMRAFGKLRTERVYDGSGTDKWTEKEFVLRHPDGFTIRFRSRGAGQAIQGSNPKEGRPCFTLDDIESDKNTNTYELRQANKKWLNSTVLPAMPSEGGKIVVDGNLIHSGGLINTLPDSPMWKPLFYQATEDGTLNTPSIWEDKWPLERLKLIRDDYSARGDIASFYRMYMNVPMSDEERQLKLTDENYHRAFLVDDWLKMSSDEEGVPFYVFIGMDPGGWLTQSRDPSAVVAVAVTPSGHTLILETDKGHWDPDEKVARFFAMARRYGKPQRAAVETVRDEDLAFQIQKQMRKERYYFTLDQYGSSSIKGKKEDRLATTLQPMLKAGDLKLRRGMGDMEEEMYGFPRGKEDHLLDALYLAVKVSYAPAEKVKAKSGGKIHSRKEERSWVTL